tara:strand:+ start:2101 stop:3510 length:1410 start_codon:yes stop_codon:yes gene_type:complete
MSNILFQAHKGAQTRALQSDGLHEICFGGSRGGGKTMVGLAWLLDYTNNPKFRGLVIRRNAEDLADWISRAREFYPYAKIVGKPAEVRFPSGAVVRCGHLSSEDAYTKYQGHEYQKILIEEATQIATEESYLKLISSCRSTVDDLIPKVMLNCNPGGKGHAWVKRRFVDVGEHNQAYKDPVTKRFRMYIPATIYDNPTLMEKDPNYVHYLEGLPEPLRSAWLLGDWNIFTGQYFTEWNPKVHVISEEDAIELGYNKYNNNHYMGIDWGFANPFCALWSQVTDDKIVFVDDELYGTERHPAEWGEMIQAKSRGRDVTLALGDPSMWARNPMAWNSQETSAYTDSSIADCLADYIPSLMKANNSRVNGWQNMAQLMHYNKKSIPSFYIIKGTCPNLERTIPAMIRCDKNPEDVDTTLEDHAPDSCRYMLSHIIAPHKPKPKRNYMQKQKDELVWEEKVLESGEWAYNWGES